MIELIEMEADVLFVAPRQLHADQHDLLTEGAVDQARGLATELTERSTVRLVGRRALDVDVVGRQIEITHDTNQSGSTVIAPM